MTIHIMLVQISRGIATIVIERSLGFACGDALHQMVRDALDEGHRALVVDLTGVSRVDAAGLGQLMQAFAAVSDRGGALRLAVSCGQIRELLDVARVTSVIGTYASATEAAASFTPCPTC